ncbi:MAG: hypothetical protein IPF92_22830 [Myxococcales bacterium]|nr:hypothetical protein [Myxococcales bacterium]
MSFRGALPAARRWLATPVGVGALAVGALGVLVGFVPLFGGVGYEHDLAAGLFCPSVAAIAVGRESSRAPGGEPLRHVVRGLSVGLLYALLTLALALGHGLRLRACDPVGGVTVYALTAGAGTVMGGAWGALVGELARGRRRGRLACATLGIALPLATALFSFGRFVRSPMIFAYDPFVGFFSGTLYDTVVDAGTPLRVYRLGSLATLTALLTLASLLRRAESGRLAWAPRGATLLHERAIVAAAAAAVSLWITASGSELGHYQSRETVAAALGGALTGARCDIVFPSSLAPEESALLSQDCEEQLAAVEARLGARGPVKITAFFFRDAGEKRRLMGAEHTYIAKPWREEVYLQLDKYPHPVLGHELAHVVAGAFGQGPFRVAGSFYGLVPNPGLIEGIAVAASPDDDDVTDLAWAKTMMDLGILPPMQRVFSLAFLGEASAKSYTLAGAFVGHILDTYGANAVRAWYGGASLEQVTSASWEALDAAFRARLATIAVAPEAAAIARARFDRPSLFGRRCPHVVDALRRKADGCRDARQVDEALAAYAAVLREDSRDVPSQISVAYLQRRYRDAAAGRAALDRLAGDASLPIVHRDRAAEALADTDFLDGAYEDAARRYTELAARSLAEDHARTLEVKALAARSADLRRPVGLLLLGDGARAPDPFVAALALGAALEARPEDAVLHYLAGRNQIQRAFYPQGIELLERALFLGTLPSPRLVREALWQLAVAACATDNKRVAQRTRAAIVDGASPFHPGGRRDAALGLLGRCAAGRP